MLPVIKHTCRPLKNKLGLRRPFISYYAWAPFGARFKVKPYRPHDLNKLETLWE